jgi:hypothetical protein
VIFDCLVALLAESGFRQHEKHFGRLFEVVLEVAGSKKV